MAIKGSDGRNTSGIVNPDSGLFPIATVPDTRNISLNKAAMKRLRWYFQRHSSKHHSQCDNADLDLIRVGAVNHHHGTSSDYLVITRVGVQLLSEELEEKRRAHAPHNSLAERLARHLHTSDRVTWLNIEFKVSPGVLVRPDVFSVVATLNEARLVPMVHEVKATRADFLSDVKNPEKRGAYSKIASYVQYCVPEELVDLREVPEDCGLVIEHRDGTFETVRRGVRNKVSLTSRHFTLQQPKVPNSSCTVGSFHLISYCCPHFKQVNFFRLTTSSAVVAQLSTHTRFSVTEYCGQKPSIKKRLLQDGQRRYVAITA